MEYCLLDELQTWARDMVTCTSHISIHEGADGRTYVRTENDVMAILPNFLPSMGYQYFFSYGAPPRERLGRARSSAIIYSFHLPEEKV